MSLTDNINHNNNFKHIGQQKTKALKYITLCVYDVHFKMFIDNKIMENTRIHATKAII